MERARHEEEGRQIRIGAAVILQAAVRGHAARQALQPPSTEEIWHESLEPWRNRDVEEMRMRGLMKMKRNRFFVWLLHFARKVAQQAFDHWRWVCTNEHYIHLAQVTFKALISEYRQNISSGKQVVKQRYRHDGENRQGKIDASENVRAQQQQTYGHYQENKVPEFPTVHQYAHQGVSMLHCEISLLAQRATKAAVKDIALVAWATAAVQHAAGKLWPAAEVLVYGSRSTGLSLPQSDLDLMIVMPAPATETVLSRDAARDYVRMLHEGLADQLQNCPWVTNVEAITSAALPLVRVLAQKPGSESRPGQHDGIILPLDISIVQGHHQGDEGTVLLQQLQAMLPNLGPLFLAIKTLLLNHGLCCAYRGGICSYGLVLLVCYFLQDPRNPANFPGTSATLDLGIAYLQLLNFVGTQFCPIKEAVALRGNLTALGSDKTVLLPQSSEASSDSSVQQGLRIRDPNNSCNNLGRTAVRFAEIQEVCRCELQRQKERETGDFVF